MRIEVLEVHIRVFRQLHFGILWFIILDIGSHPHGSYCCSTYVPLKHLPSLEYCVIPSVCVSCLDGMANGNVYVWVSDDLPKHNAAAALSAQVTDDIDGSGKPTETNYLFSLLNLLLHADWPSDKIVCLQLLEGHSYVCLEHTVVGV